MKKQILKLVFTFLVIGLLSLNGQSILPELSAQEQTENDDYECRYGQCHATAKSTGRRCKHCVSNPGDYYCWQHD